MNRIILTALGLFLCINSINAQGKKLSVTASYAKNGDSIPLKTD